MSASISEPFVLSSSSVQRGGTNVIRSFAQAISGPEGEAEVIITVQGEGVRVIDLTSYNVILSQTFDTSTRFSAACTACVEDDGDSKKRVVYVPSKDASTTPGSTLVSKWEHGLFQNLGKIPERLQTRLVPWEVEYIYHSVLAPELLLLFSSLGHIEVLNTNLLTLNAIRPESSSYRRLETFVFHSVQRTFDLPPQLPQHSTLILNVFVTEGEVLLRPIVLSEKTPSLAVLDFMVIKQEGNVSAVTIDSSGFVSLLLTSGVWLSYRLHHNKTSTFTLTELGATELEPLILSPSGTARPEGHISLLPLPNCRVLMGYMSYSNPPTLRLAMWDMQYSVILASCDLISLPAAAAIPSGKDVTFSLRLLVAGSEQCLCLVVISEPGSVSSLTLRYTSLISSLSLPPRSTVGGALHGQINSKVTSSPDESRRHLLNRISEAILEDKAHLPDLFFQWLESDTSKQNEQESQGAFLPAQQRGKIVAPRVQARKETKTSPCTYPFTAELVQIIMAPKVDKKDYQKIMTFLLDRKLVSQNMIEGGVTNTLLTRKDWDTIDLALRNMSDISEADIVSLIHHLATTSQEQVPEELQPKRRIETGTLPQLLARCLRYPMAPFQLRQALHLKFSDARDVLPILAILDNWLEIWISRGPLIGFDCDLDKHLSKTKTPFDPQLLIRKVERRTGVPPLETILCFIEIILDTFFIQLSLHSDSQPILRQLLLKIEPFAAVYRDLEDLREPLVPFKSKLSEIGKPLTPRTPPSPGLIIQPYQMEEVMF